MSSILLYLKAPRCGYVKTRLAQHVGAERALEVYRALVKRQCSALPEAAQIEVHYAPHDARIEMQNWLGEHYDYYPQPEGELGVRLRHSIQCAFDRGAKSICCIGGDCPQLEARHIEEAEQLMAAGHDVVFGPSEDGGYYLIALKSPQPELFQGIPWSTRDTLKASLDKASSLGLKVGMLETLYDIDEVNELERALAERHLRIERSV